MPKTTNISLPYAVFEECVRPGETWDLILKDVLCSVFYEVTGRQNISNEAEVDWLVEHFKQEKWYREWRYKEYDEGDGYIHPYELENRVVTLQTQRGAHTVVIHIVSGQRMYKNTNPVWEFTIRGVKFTWRYSVAGVIMETKKPEMEGDLS